MGYLTKLLTSFMIYFSSNNQTTVIDKMESIKANFQLLNGYYHNMVVWMVRLWTKSGGVHCVATPTSKF